MKKFLSISAMVTALSFMVQSCVKDKLKSTYTYYLPVYKSKSEVWQNIKSVSPQPLLKTGKLFLYGRYIFINEVNKGVHVIDNFNPAAPKNMSFIAIPGNLDIAVKNNILYADLYSDIVTIDIADPANSVLKKVTTRVFREREYNNGFASDTTKYVVDWVKQVTSEKNELASNLPMQPPMTWYTASEVGVAAGKAITGISGSMARFTIVNNYLYTVSNSNLTAFNIASPADPVSETEQSLGWNIETIYPLKDKLFIGSQTGMFIFGFTDPAKPSLLSTFSHACFNDPVIADDKYAYVTLRASGESSCWGPAVLRNELDIVDISNILQPSLVQTYGMNEPKGLSKDGNNLFICDGKAGLKIYDVSSITGIKELRVIKDINPFDVICQSGLAIVVTDEGIYQYDYTNINDIKLVSRISTAK